MDKSKNTIRLILIHHCQNPTKMKPVWAYTTFRTLIFFCLSIKEGIYYSYAKLDVFTAKMFNAVVFTIVTSCGMMKRWW
jgi:hypothetical protein